MGKEKQRVRILPAANNPSPFAYLRSPPPAKSRDFGMYHTKSNYLIDRESRQGKLCFPFLLSCHTHFRPFQPSVHPTLPASPFRHSALCFDSKPTLRKVRLPLLLALRDFGCLGFGQAAADGAGVARPQVERNVLFALVVQAQLVPLGGVDDCEDAGDGFAEVVAEQVNKRVKKWPLARTAGGIWMAYMRVSLLALPPAIFCVRNWPSSVFSSSSCLVRSSLLLFHSCVVFTLAVDCHIQESV